MADLEELRREIDAIDEVLIAELGRRFAVVRKVAAYKKAHGIPAILPERIDQVKSRCVALGARQGLDDVLIEALYDKIIDAACRLEEDIMRVGAA